MSKHNLTILLIAGLIFGGVFGFKYYQSNQNNSQRQAPPPAVVAVTQVKQEYWPPILETVGTLVAVSGVAVSNEIAGKVHTIHFKSGQNVKRGQLLLELDAVTDQADLKGLLAEQRLAKIRYQRANKLIRDQFTSQSDYDQTRAQLEEAKAAAESKQTVIAKKQIRAPFSGELGIRQVDLGQYLSPGSMIVSLQKRQPIYVDFSIPEKQLSQFSIGQAILISVQAFQDKTFSGKITAINPSIDFETRSVKVRALLQNEDLYLRPGMFAKVQLISDQKIPVLTLPDTAIAYNPYGNSVFVVKSDQNQLIAQNRQVETGMTRNGRIAITNGLVLGEQVVSAGQVKLRNGMPVIADDKSSPGEQELMSEIH